MVRWQWQKDLRKKDEDEEGVFEDYGPAEMAKLEAAYKKGQTSMDFGKLYKIDFKHMIQYRVADKERQRPIRRLEEDETEVEPEPKPKKTKLEPEKKASVLWLWQKDLRLKEDRADAWTLYEPDKQTIIEAAYQADKADTSFKLDKNRALNFEDMCQFRIADPERQRPVKRLVGESAPKKKEVKDDSDDDAPLRAVSRKSKKDGLIECLGCGMRKAADKMKVCKKNDIRICFACDEDTGDVVKCEGCDEWWHMDGECACSFGD